MDCVNNSGMLLLVTVAMWVIPLSSFACAKSNGDNLRHNDVTLKDATLSNVNDFVTSFLTSPGAVPDRLSSNGDTLRYIDVTSEDVKVDNQVTSSLTSSGVIPDTNPRAIPERIRRAISAIPDIVPRAVPESVYRVITEIIHRAVPDTNSRAIPYTKRRAIPEKTRRAIPDRHRRATKICTVDCSRVRHRPVCGTDRRTYRHKCELKQIRRCEGRRVRAVPMVFCTGIHGNSAVTAQLLFLNVNF